jgi:hypothetical protein
VSLVIDDVGEFHQQKFKTVVTYAELAVDLPSGGSAQTADLFLCARR